MSSGSILVSRRSCGLRLAWATTSSTLRPRHSGRHIGSAVIEAKCATRPRSARHTSKCNRVESATHCKPPWSWIGCRASLLMPAGVPGHGIPVFSVYGDVRKPTDAMMDTCDVILVDLQDLGCRIYTFITTLRYVLEAASTHHKAVWVLDRPNPVGRPVEGLTLRSGWQSFVGAGPLPMRHGLTLGELGLWFVRTLKLDLEYRIVEMQGWRPDVAPGYGWPVGRGA